MKHTLRHLPRLLGLVMPVLVVALLLNCSEYATDPTAPVEPASPAYTAFHPHMLAAISAQEQHTPALMAHAEVVGTAVGLTEDGQPAVLVLLQSELGLASTPVQLDGIPVLSIVTGPIKAYKTKPPTPSADHKARQPRPIELGVSGGNAKDFANGYCCSGTLGALVQSGNQQYILSNSHVFAADIASSPTDPDVAQINDPINQPGLIDVNCSDISNDYVATLSTLTSLVGGSNVDAALAKVMSNMVRSDGSILEIGTLSSQTVAPSVNKAVKKSGRTTGLTRSKISGLNATITVGYEDECAGQAFSKTFTGQIIITNRANKFLAGGDSGSLLVEDVSTNPRAIGLLFAGGGNIAVANPINEVLNYLNVSMVGN